MEYTVELLQSALKDLDNIDKSDAQAIVKRIYSLSYGLVGDIKKLNNYDPSHRLRIGKYRVLFALEGTHITIARIKHRKDAYKQKGKIMELNPQIIEIPDGKLVVLPYDEYLFLTELLEDYNDSLLVNEAMEDKENREGSITAEELMKRMGLMH